MANFMAPLNNYMYVGLRVSMGLLFMFHGTQKVFGWPVHQVTFMSASNTYLVGPIELIGGVCVVIGLMTRWCAFVCGGLMGFAYWWFHGTRALLPLLNHGETAFLFCVTFLYIASHGPGIWSVDRMRGAS